VTLAPRNLLTLLLRGAVTLLRALPPRSVPALAWTGGTIWYLCDRRRRGRIRQNLKIAFGPTLAPAARRRLARDVFRHMARIPLEVIWFDRLATTPSQLERRCTFHGAWEPGRGGVLYTGHLGAWEMLIRAAPLRLGRLVTVVRRIRDPAIDAFVNRARGEVVAKHGAFPELVRVVREGAWVFLAGDQNAGAAGPFIPFLGLPASTHVSPALLALREGVPLVLAVAVRRPGSEMHFDLHLEAVAEPAAHEPTPEELHDLLTRLHARLEAWVREIPQQYNFLHRRWKDRPPGELPGPHLPSYDHHRPRI
jgi:KDO2-lipid IV(A) lauroyltransferase